MKTITKRFIAALALCATLIPVAAYSFFWKKPVDTYKRVVYINNERLSDARLERLQRQHQVAVRNGEYWYDPVSGHWGAIGTRPLGRIAVGLQFARLREVASNGQSQVTINGRRLQWQEVRDLQKLIGYMQPGKYWLDAQGHIGRQGGPIIANIYRLASGNNTAGTAVKNASPEQGKSSVMQCPTSVLVHRTKLISADC